MTSVPVNPRYPQPDRSNFVPNEHRDDPHLPEGDLGYLSTVLPDGRPARIEHWYSEGMTLLTLFFSTLDLESATPEALLGLVSGELEAAKVSPEFRRLDATSVHRIKDAQGRDMYSLTFVVKDSDF